MRREVRPTIIVPVRAASDGKTAKTLAGDAYAEATLGHPIPYVVLAAASDAASLREAWEDLRAKVVAIDEAKGETYVGGASGLEAFAVRFLLLADAGGGDTSVVWRALSETWARVEALDVRAEGTAILTAEKLTEEDEAASIEFRRKTPCVPVLIEQWNPAGRYPVASEKVRDTALTIVDLLINAVSPHDRALNPFLQTAGLGKRVIAGAAVFDPGKDLLEAFRVAAVDANYPRALAFLATAEALGEDDEIEAANALAGAAIDQIAGELIPEREPALPDHPELSTDPLRFFSRQSTKVEAYDEVERDFRARLEEYARKMVQASAADSEGHREGLRDLPVWAARFLGAAIEKVTGTGSIGHLWPKDLHNVLESLAGGEGAGRLYGRCADWIERARKDLKKKLEHRVGWTEWEDPKLIRAQRRLRPRWIAYLWPALTAIGLLLLHYYRERIPFLGEVTFLPRLALLVVSAALIHTGICAFRFHRSKIRLFAQFSDRSDEIRRFFLANTHEQRLSFVQEAVNRTIAGLGCFSGKLGAYLASLRRFAEEREKIAVIDHKRIRELAEVYSEKLIRKAVDLLGLEPNEARIEEIAASIAARLTKENLPEFVEDPDRFRIWVRTRVSEYFVEKKSLTDGGALVTARMVDAVFAQIEKEARCNRPVPYFHKAGVSRGIVFFPAGYDSSAAKLQRELSADGDIATLPVLGRGRFGILNLYEREIDG